LITLQSTHRFVIVCFEVFSVKSMAWCFFAN